MVGDREELVEILSPFFQQMRKLESQLQCAKCSNLLEEPTLLPCNHIICRECIVVDGKNGNSCPICESQFHCRGATLKKSNFSSQASCVSLRICSASAQSQIWPCDDCLADSKSAVHVSKMVGIFREMDAAIVKIVQRSQTQNAALTREGNSPTRPCHVESTKTSATKGHCEKVEFHPTEEVNLPTADPNNAEAQQRSCRANNVGTKRGISEGNEGATISKRPKGKQHNKQRPPTPINLFDDECVFCHSFRTSQVHGPMVCYLNGRLVTADERNRSGVIYVHQKCLEWAPRVCYKGETIMNLKSEINRASRLKCSRCGLPGAALGCYYEKCMKSFHVPCAVQILDCRWDVDNCHVLCPQHVSQRLPCDDFGLPTKDGDDFAPLPQSHFSDKLEGMTIDQQTADRQTDRLNTQSSNLRNEWVLLGSALSASEKDLLHEFATLADATVSEKWTTNVTHVIVAKNDASAWSRSHEALMAILSGKWVVTIEWIRDGLVERHPVPEDSYEIKISHNLYGSINGPKKGRTRAAEGAPKLFAGLSFCFSAYLNSRDKDRLENLITAAEGKILKENGLESFPANSNETSVKPYFVYDGGAPEEFTSSSLLEVKKEIEECIEYAASGAQVISHIRVFNAIAAYDAQIFSSKDHFTLDMCL